MAVIEGTVGDDFLFGDEEADTIRGFEGNDTILGVGGDDSLDGGEGDDEIAGGGGADVLLGGAGDDTLAGDSNFEAAGVDTLTGGAGNDRFEWDPFGGASTAALTDVVTDFQGAGDAIGDTLELASFSPPIRFSFGGRLPAMPALGSSLGVAGDALAAILYAFSGGDTFVLADTNDSGAYDAADFTVRLTGRQNLVRSDFGATEVVIAGSPGPDAINGTAGNDTILGLGGGDSISARGGDDVVEGGGGADTLDGGDGMDRVEGGNGADRITGGGGRDVANGDAGDDDVDGGGGDDNVAGDAGDDVVSGGNGDDNVDGDDGNDTLFGGAGGDDMFGLEGDDVMFGDSGEDELFGGGGDDALSGGADADELEGEEGADRVEGGGGADQMNFFTSALQPDSTFAVRDFVLDFQRAGQAGGDQLRLSGGEFAWVGQINASPVTGSILPGAGDGILQLGYIRSNGSTFLVSDTNDNGRLNNNDFTVEFRGALNFTTDDFDNTDFIIAGTNGDDTITGTEGDDRISAAGGDDQVAALGGDDEVHGGAGDDALDGGEGGFDQLFGEEGNDDLSMSAGGGVAFGGDGDDVLFGSDVEFGFSELHGDLGDDNLHAGSIGSSLIGGGGSDRLFGSAENDQMEAGRDEFGFDLDNAQDLFVYTGVGRWSSADSSFGDDVSGFQDGSDLFDMRGSGLGFADLTVVNEEFQTTITSARGKITISESFGQEVFIDRSDFLFDMV